MKSIFQFLRTTLSGGILFLLPIVLLITILNKAHLMLVKISAPLAKMLPDFILGIDGSRLLAILLLVMGCFIGGLLIRSPRVKRGVSTLEENVLSYLPGYSLVKSIAADAIGEKIEHSMTTVLVQDGDTWNIGFLVEEGEGLCTVFFPEAPRHDSGEVKIVPAAMVRKIGVSSNKAARSLKSYGKGAIQWMGNP